MAIRSKLVPFMYGRRWALLITVPPSTLPLLENRRRLEHERITGIFALSVSVICGHEDKSCPAARSNPSSVTQYFPVSYRESLEDFLPVSIALFHKHDIRAKRRVLRPYHPARGPSQGALAVIKFQFKRLGMNFRHLMAYLGCRVQHAYAACSFSSRATQGSIVSSISRVNTLPL